MGRSGTRSRGRRPGEALTVVGWRTGCAQFQDTPAEFAWGEKAGRSRLTYHSGENPATQRSVHRMRRSLACHRNGLSPKSSVRRSNPRASLDEDFGKDLEETPPDS